jgi:NAD(P)-dependent dehydrogenase (short-subunit alcohol dehydrogenase family)
MQIGGSVALVTGANRGLGLAFTRELARRGAAHTGAPDIEAARTEMETNYFGTLSMCRAFAPVLAANGGGAIVNTLSVTSF